MPGEVVLMTAKADLKIVDDLDPKFGEILLDLNYKAHSGKDLLQLNPNELLGRIGAEDECELIFAGLAHIEQIADLQPLEYALGIEELMLELLCMGPADLLMQVPESLLVGMSLNEV